MSNRIKELREKRGAIVVEMRAVIEAAEKEKRDLSGEELAKHEELFKKCDGYRQQIEAEERTLDGERQNAAKKDELEQRLNNNSTKTEAELRNEKLLEGFRAYLRTGKIEAANEEFRAFQAGSDTEGGYVVAPQQVVQQLLKNVDDLVWMRQLAYKIQLASAASLGVPTLDTDAADWDWTVELKTGNEETSMRIGKREFRAYPLAKRVKISKTLLRQAPAFEQIIMSRLAYKLSITQEKAYLTGDGNRKPLGVFIASNDGIPTSRDVSTGNTTTAFTVDGLIESKYSVKAQYWPKATWVFHRDAVKMLTKLKDGEGQYLWQPSIVAGQPDQILNAPLRVSEFAPNTFTTGLYVGLFGDFSQYWICDALDMQMQRLVELYAETNQDGYIGRYEGDGCPVIAEAFARVKLA